MGHVLWAACRYGRAFLLCFVVQAGSLFRVRAVGFVLEVVLGVGTDNDHL